MLGFAYDFGINVAANVAVALAFGYIAVLYVRRARRKGIRDFFGFEQGRDKMHFLLSTIAVKVNGTTGTCDVDQGFHGDAITEVEYRHALNLAIEVERGSGSWLISTILGSRAGADPVSASINQSPSFSSLLKEGGEVQYRPQLVESALKSAPCTVVVGAPVYNLAAHFVLQTRSTMGAGSSRARFLREGPEEGNGRGIEFHGRGKPRPFWRQEEESGTVEDFYIVEKITMGGTKVFVCAGTCTAATAAAMKKLGEWRRWAARYGDEDFIRLYSWYSGTGTEEAVERRESDPSFGESLFRAEYPEK